MAARGHSHGRRSTGRQRGTVVLIVALLLIVGSIVYIATQRGSSSDDFAGSGNGQVQLVEIAPGSNMSSLGPELAERGIVKTNAAFQQAAANNPQASSVQPGVYRLQEEMSASSAVAALLNGANKVETLKITGGSTLEDVKVVGGDTRFGIFTQIHNVTCTEGSVNCLSLADIKRAAGTMPLDQLGVPEWAREAVKARGTDPKRLEGLIMPGDYVINPSMDAQAVLQDLVTKSAAELDKASIVERAQAIGLSPYQLLTAASLIEREAPANDFDKVARVVLNRLNEPMRLEFDSTVNYDLAEKEVATTDADRARVTPWNTYAKDGLPDTPIASASLEAIKAMENPAEGDWLFFVTIDKQGNTVFTNSFEDHQRATQDAINSGVLDSKREQ